MPMLSHFLHLPLKKLLTFFLGISCLMGPADDARAEYFPFLRVGNFTCSKEHVRTLEHIIDAENQKELEGMVLAAVFAGSCTGVSPVATAITNIRSQKSPKGNEYFCFNRDEEGGITCTLSRFVTDIDSEVERRNGDYRVVLEGPTTLKAECIEGGSVMLFKEASGWTKGLLVFPKQLTPSIRSIFTDKDSALRDGCRGLDYQAPSP